jgi:hypothetical protein
VPVVSMSKQEFGRLEKLWSTVASDLATAIMPEAGHWLGDENPAATAEALATFFT